MNSPRDTDSSTGGSLTDPESLFDRDDVDVRETVHTVDRETFETARDELDSHAVVGLADEAGSVLLMNDGSHGWTLVAVPVEAGEDWAAVARRGMAELTGIDVDVQRPERVRRIEYRLEGDEARTTALYNAVWRAAPVTEGTDSLDPGETNTEFGWFEQVPDGTEGPPAEDIRLFIDRT